MPIWSALIPAVASLAGGFLGNKGKNDAYQQQRRDTIADWNRTNAYNAPSAQMQRYKDAGLNPHLIYGQSNTAPSVSSVKREGNEYDFIGGAFQQFIQIQQMEAETDRIKAAAALTKQQTSNALQANQFKEDSYGYDLETNFQKSLKGRSEIFLNEERAAQTRASTDYTIAQNARAAAQSKASIKESIQRVLESVARTKNLPVQKMYLEAQIDMLKSNKAGKDTMNQIMEYELKLRHSGLSPTELGYERLKQQLITEGVKAFISGTRKR